MSEVEVERPSLTSIARRRFNEICTGVWLVNAMAAAASLEIPDAVGEEPVTADALAARLGLDAPSLHRLLRALAANGIFEEAGEATYRHNELSRQLRKDHPVSLHSLAVFMGGDIHSDAWQGITGALRDGRAGFFHRRGVSLYDHLRDHPADAARFNGAMVSHSLQSAAAIPAALPVFRGARSVVDLGGGLGTLTVGIAKAYPEIRGIVLDLPHLQAAAAGFLAHAGVGDRVTFLPGDFFESVPDGQDVYILKSVLWNWDDERCVRILQNVRRAMGDSKHGRLLIMEPILLPENLPFTSLFDLQMLAVTAAGRSRTAVEYSEIARRSRFVMESIVTVEETTVAECSPV